MKKTTILLAFVITASFFTSCKNGEKATAKITKGRTSIIIAHRLATIQNADKIIVMDKGEIVEFGTHQALLKNKEGVYRGLYEAQFLKEKELS